MKRAALGILAALAATATVGMAQAADMAVKGPAPVAPIYEDWSGFYFDVAAGWERDSYNWNWINPALVAAGFGAVPMSSPTGLSLGAHVGYQQQFSWLVVGLEAGASKINGNPTSTSPYNPAVMLPCGFNTFCRAQTDWVSTAGGKLGVAWQNWLLYGVGGKAFGANINTAAILAATGAILETYLPQNDTGWYWGVGFDYMLLKTNFGDLIGGVEYEHIALGTINSAINTFGNSDRNSISLKEDIVWGKLTLKFNPFGGH